MIRFHLHGYGTFDDARAIGPAVWPYFDLLTLHDGSVTITFARRFQHALHAGQAVLIYPHTHFEGGAAGAGPARAAVQHFSIERDGATSEPFKRLAARRNGFEIFRSYRGLDEDVRRAMWLPLRAQGPLVHAMREAQLTLILGELMHGADPDSGSLAVDTTLDDAIDWARRNVARGLRVEDLARRVGLSTSRFRDRFKQQTGRSAGRFLADLALVEAQRRLRETREPIKQIARAVGYAHVVAFHHAFRARHGMTPTDYRRAYTPAG